MTPTQEGRALSALEHLAREFGLTLVPIASAAAPAPKPPKPEPPPNPWPGDRLKALRTALGLTQTAFAKRIGITAGSGFAAISQMEHGRWRVHDRYHQVLDALELEARRKIQANPTPAPTAINGPIQAAPAGTAIRRREACGCERVLGVDRAPERVVRLCVQHGPQPTYRPAPPRLEPRPAKEPTVPLPRSAGAGDVLCRCKHAARDHERNRFRCFVCGTGHGAGCQMFRSA